MEEEQVSETAEATQETSTPQAQEQPATPAPKPAPVDSGPPPVPYSVFSKTNAELRALQTRATELEKQLSEYGPEKVQALQSQIETAQRSADLRIGLVKSGAEDQYLDYLADRYNGLTGDDRPPAAEWAATLKASEPAFFGSSSAATSTAPATETPAAAVAAVHSTPPPTTNPDATVSPAANSAAQPRPLSDATIKAMSQAEFADRWEEIQAWRMGKASA